MIKLGLTFAFVFAELGLGFMNQATPMYKENQKRRKNGRGSHRKNLKEIRRRKCEKNGFERRERLNLYHPDKKSKP